MVLLAAIDIDMCPQVHRELLFRATARERDDFVAHPVRILDSQMAQTAQALDCDKFTRWDVHLAHTVEDCDTSAEKGGGVGGADVVRYTNGGFGAQDAVFSD